jgi:hypothetical protein
MINRIMSEIRNRFKNDGAAASMGVMMADAVVPDVDVAELNNVVDEINNDLDKLVESADKRNETLNELTKSMYVSDTDEKDNESEGQEEQEEDTDESKAESEADSEEQDDDESDDGEEQEGDEGDDGEEQEGDEGDEEDADEESEKSDKHCHTQTRIIFVPVRQKEDDGIPGLITGVATLLLFAWAMRALCLICAIGSECYPKSS